MGRKDPAFYENHDGEIVPTAGMARVFRMYDAQDKERVGHLLRFQEPEHVLRIVDEKRGHMVVSIRERATGKMLFTVKFAKTHHQGATWTFKSTDRLWDLTVEPSKIVQDHRPQEVQAADERLAPARAAMVTQGASAADPESSPADRRAKMLEKQKQEITPTMLQFTDQHHRLRIERESPTALRVRVTERASGKALFTVDMSKTPHQGGVYTFKDQHELSFIGFEVTRIVKDHRPAKPWAQAEAEVLRQVLLNGANKPSTKAPDEGATPDNEPPKSRADRWAKMLEKQKQEITPSMMQFTDQTHRLGIEKETTDSLQVSVMERASGKMLFRVDLSKAPNQGGVYTFKGRRELSFVGFETGRIIKDYRPVSEAAASQVDEADALRETLWEAARPGVAPSPSLTRSPRSISSPHR